MNLFKRTQNLTDRMRKNPRSVTESNDMEIKLNLPGIFYDFHYYDRYFRLKIPFRLWLIIFCGMKSSLIFIFTLLLEDRPNDALVVLGSPLFLPVSLISLIVIFAGNWRVAGAVPWKKQLWHKSHALLSTAFAISVTLLCFFQTYPALQGDGWEPNMLTAVLLLDLLILLYLISSPFIRDVFADFPEKHDFEYFYLRIFTHS